MKKLLLFLGVLFCFASQGQAAETLSFKLANPRISYFAPTNYFVFDIYVKGSVGSSYLYASQVICNINISNVNTSVTPSIALASGFEANYTKPSPPFTTAPKYSVVGTWFSNNLNLAILHTVDFDSYYPASYTSVPGSYVLFGSVYVPLTAGAVNGTAGISFLTSSMNGQQKYATGVAPWSDYYTTPNLYEAKDFSDIYLARMYSAGYSWTQYGGTMDWSTSVNTSVWDTLSSAATISGTVAGTECKVKGLRIHNGGRLKIDKDHPLTCSGNTDIANERGLWIASASAGTGSFKDNGTINYTIGGSVNVERFLEQNKWHYISVPVVSTLTNPLQGLYVTRYDEPNHHFRYILSLDSTLNTQALGYGIWSDGANATVNFKGSLNTGPIAVNTTETWNVNGWPTNTPPLPAQLDGWNLVGNPYPSAIDLSLVTGTWSNVEATAWFWNGSVGNYFVYPTGGAGTHTKYAPAMQGFFVHCLDATATQSHQGTGVMNLSNTARVHNTEAFLKEGKNLPNMLVVKALSSQNSYSDELRVYFDPSRTNVYEPGYDALKFAGYYDAPQIYTVNDGNNLSVNALPFATQNIVVPMGFGVGVDGMYTIKADNLASFDDNISIYLEDLQLHKLQDLRTNPVYNLTYHSGDDYNRFLLHFNNPYLGTNEVKGDKPVSIFSFDNAVYVKISTGNTVKGSLTIFDLLGRKVFERTLQNLAVNKFETGLIQGNYVVTVTSEEGTFNSKINLK